METRTEKYNTTAIKLPSRTDKNKQLYDEISKYEIDKFDLESNAKVLGNNNKTIDVEKIKKIIDTRYNDAPKRRSIRIEEEEIVENTKLDETTEYDINAILEKAKSEKVVDYEKERLKKLRDTQFDILKSLELNTEMKKETNKEEELINLINTITAKEFVKQEATDPLDILSDLKGSDKTEVVNGIIDSVTKELEKNEKTTKEIKIPEKEEKIKNPEEKFYTTSNSFTQSDFDDFIDLKKEVKSNKIGLKIVIGVIIVAVLIAFAIFLNNFLDLGLF